MEDVHHIEQAAFLEAKKAKDAWKKDWKVQFLSKLDALAEKAWQAHVEAAAAAVAEG